MVRQIALIDIICNAFNRNYSLDQAATDLGALITELRITKLRYGTDSSRLSELEKIIPAQERLALGKLYGDQLFAQLDQFRFKLEKYN